MREEARTWMRAASDPEVGAAMERIYDDVRREIEARGPACWASGRCCNFEKAGHRLYVTGVEAALTVRGISRSGSGGVALTAASLDHAVARGGCPFQRGNLCGAHEHRPLGCRVFFCDRSAQQWQQELCERALTRVRATHELHGVPYHYGEWRAMLRELLDAGVSS